MATAQATRAPKIKQSEMRFNLYIVRAETGETELVRRNVSKNTARTAWLYHLPKYGDQSAIIAWPVGATIPSSINVRALKK